MAKFKELKNEVREQSKKLRQEHLIVEDARRTIQKLRDKLEQRTIERDAARSVEAHNSIIIRRLRSKIKMLNNSTELTVSPTKLTLANRRLQNEVNHLRKLVNTRRR